jgi:hypothetical protein
VPPPSTWLSPTRLSHSTLFLGLIFSNFPKFLGPANERPLASVAFLWGHGFVAKRFKFATVSRSEQISGRLDASAVKQYLGESWRRFEVATVSTVIRVKAVQRLASAA